MYTCANLPGVIREYNFKFLFLKAIIMSIYKLTDIKKCVTLARILTPKLSCVNGRIMQLYQFLLVVGLLNMILVLVINYIVD